MDTAKTIRDILLEEIQKQDSLRVRTINDEMELAISQTQEERDRNRDSWIKYGGIDGQQYSMADKAMAASEGRTLQTFNIVTQKVDSLHGAILKNPYDANFNAVEPGDSHWTTILDQMYKSDKEQMDWETSYSELVLGGLIHEASEEMYIDRRLHPLGNIAFRCHLPGRIIYDPSWKTPSAKDCKKCWRVAYMTAEEIVEYWPHLKIENNRLVQDIEQVKSHGQDWEAHEKGVVPSFALPIPGGLGRYRVIFYYEMKNETVQVEYEVTTGKSLPETTDLAVKAAWLDQVNPDWDKTSVRMRPETRKICYQTVICPEISQWLIIESKKSEIQIGRLPFFPWSAARINGVPRGIVDLIKDIQDIINNRENLISYIAMTEANSAIILDPALFGGDDKQCNDFIENKNRPGRVFKSVPGATRSDLMPKRITGGTYSPYINEQLMRMWDYSDRLSKSPAVFDARTESQNESGYLFAQRTNIAQQQQYILFNGLRRHSNEKAEAYMLQSKIQYSIEGIRRDFMLDSGTKHISLNKRTQVAEGEYVLENDISNLPRQRVVISESPSGLTVRLVNRQIAVETLKIIPQEELGTRSVMASMFCETLDNLSEEQKKRLKECRELEDQQAMETMRANISNMKLKRLQAEQQIKALENPAPAPNLPKNPALPPPAADGRPEPQELTTQGQQGQQNFMSPATMGA